MAIKTSYTEREGVEFDVGGQVDDHHAMAAVEEFLDEAAAEVDSIYGMTTTTSLDTTDKYHQGFRQRQQQWKYRMLMTVMSIVAVLTVIGLVIGFTPNPNDTEIKSLESITGHAFNLQANVIVDPHYVGPLDPNGVVTLRFNDDNHFLLTVRAKGLEDVCETCSIRVETSTSCTEPAIGIGLWNPQFHHRDPWDLLHYTSRNGITHTAVPTFTGDPPEIMEGHVIRLGDSQGQPIACGILERDTSPRRVKTLYATMQNFGTKYNRTRIEGTVLLQFFINTNDDDDTSFLATMDNFQGLPPYCERCPISIQEGMTCDDGIGSHYFNHSTMERDPWTTDRGAYFKTDSQGMGIKRSFFLDIGHGYLDTKGHAVLLKGPDHSRIACGILSSNKPKSKSTSSSSSANL